MKILVSWLNEYGDFGDPTDADAVQRVADALTSLGLEVDSIDAVGETVDGGITARILRLESHPDAAKVQRVYVDAVLMHVHREVRDALMLRHVGVGASNQHAQIGVVAA